MAFKEDIYHPPESSLEIKERLDQPISRIKRADRFLVLYLIQPVVALVIVAVSFAFFIVITMIVCGNKPSSTTDVHSWIDVISFQAVGFSGLILAALAIRSWFKAFIPEDYKQSFVFKINTVIKALLVPLFISILYIFFKIVSD